MVGVGTIPTLRTVADLLGDYKAKRGIADDAQSELLEKAAEGQLSNEREGESTFLKVLDYLARPQRAIAGIIYDSMDGGDWSPGDRVGQALAGRENYGMKDVIDIIHPGDLSQVKLPDWLPIVGGNEVDLTKEVTGFIGDVFTDPLMYVNLGGLVGRTARVGLEEIELAAKISNKLPKYGKRLTERINKEAAALGAATRMQQGVVNQRETVGHLRWVFDEVMKDPENFIKQFPEYTKDINKFKAIAAAKGYTAPTVAQQISQGQRHILGMRLKILGTNKGIGDVSLLPYLDRTLGAGVAEMMGKTLAHLRVSRVGNSFVDGVENLFRYSTGNPLLDISIFKAMGRASKDGREYSAMLNAVKKEFGGEFDDEIVRSVLDHLERPNWLYGGASRPISNPKVASIVEKLRDIYRKMDDVEVKELGIRKTSLDYGTLYSPAKTYNSLKKLYEAEKKGIIDTSGYHKRMLGNIESEMQKRYSSKELQAMVKDGVGITEKGKKARGEVLGDIMQEEMRRGSKQLHETIPMEIHGYFPRKLTPEGRDAFAHFVNHPKVLYGGERAASVLTKSSLGRNIKNMSVEEFNSLIDQGTLPHNFINQVVDQARTISKTDKGMRKMFTRFMKDQGKAFHFFIEDPIQATSLRIAESLRATTNVEALNHIHYLTARTVTSLSDMRLGEDIFMLTPEGMESILGKGWAQEIGESAHKIYKSVLENQRMVKKPGLNNLYLALDSAGMSQLAAAKVPFYALPTKVVDHVGKMMRMRTDANEANLFLRAFDDVTNWFKAATLAVFPGFHARNVISNMFQMHLGGTMKVGNFMDAGKFIKAARLWDDSIHIKTAPSLDNFYVRTDSGALYGGARAQNDIMKYGVLETFQRTELPEAMAKSTGTGVVKAVAKAVALRPGGLVVRKGFEAGHAIEGYQRLAHYFGKIKEGLSPMESALSVKKYFHNYSELTNFERSVLRRAMPFYTWSRKNIPLQLEAMLTQPGKYGNISRVVEFLQSDEAKEMDPKLLPKWVHENMGIPTRTNKKTGGMEVMLLRSWLPAADLMAVVHSNPAYSLSRQALTLLNPIPKAALEQHQNRSFFTERKLSEFPGEAQRFLGMPMNKRAVHLLKNVRVLSEIDRALAEGRPGDLEGWARFWNTTGLATKVRGFDVPIMKKRYRYEINKRKRELGQALGKAKKLGDKELIEYYRNLMEDASAVEKRIGGDI